MAFSTTTVTHLDLDGLRAQRNDTPDRRRVELRVPIEERADGSSIRLALNLSHSDKGRYFISLWRETVRDGFTTVSLHDDSAFSAYEVRGARYSAKNLQALAAEYQTRLPEYLERFGDWAREVPSR